MCTHHKIASSLILILFATPCLADGLFKCEQNGRVLYQSLPCPSGFQTLPVAPPATRPSPEEQTQAKVQARVDLAAAERLRQRDAKAELERRTREAKAEQHDQTCARRLEIIRMMESIPAADGSRKTARRRAVNERKAYILQCGPLPIGMR